MSAHRPTPPTLGQAELIWRAGLNPAFWLVRMEDELYLHLVGKDGKLVVIIDRTTGEIVKRP